LVTNSLKTQAKNVCEIGFQNSFITTAAAFQNGYCQSERPKDIESR
jgi:hypothetical protein